MIIVQPRRHKGYNIIILMPFLIQGKFKLEHYENENRRKKKYNGLDFSQNDVIIEIINKGSFLIGKPVSF